MTEFQRKRGIGDLNHVAGETLEVWRLRRSVNKDFPGEACGVLSGRQNI